MTDEEVKTQWLETHRRLSAEADAFKNSQAVSFGLLDTYDGLSSYERTLIHSILADWMLSDDNRLRYDAKFLTRQRCIRAMKASVEKAIAKCESRTGPEAHDEAEDLRRILSELE
jgi:hypothetical protein